LTVSEGTWNHRNQPHLPIALVAEPHSLGLDGVNLTLGRTTDSPGAATRSRCSVPARVWSRVSPAQRHGTRAGARRPDSAHGPPQDGVAGRWNAEEAVDDASVWCGAHHPPTAGRLWRPRDARTGKDPAGEGPPRRG